MLDYKSEMIADDIFYQADLEDMSSEEYKQAMKELLFYERERELAYDRIQEALAFMEDLTDPISDAIKAILKGEPHD